MMTTNSGKRRNPQVVLLLSLALFLCSVVGLCDAVATTAGGGGDPIASSSARRRSKSTDGGVATDRDKGTSDKEVQDAPAPTVTPFAIPSSDVTAFPTSAPRALLSTPPVVAPTTSESNRFNATSSLNTTSTRPTMSPTATLPLRQTTLPPSSQPSLFVDADANNNNNSNATMVVDSVPTNDTEAANVRVASLSSGGSLDMLLIWSIVAAGIALSTTGSLLLFRRRHKFVQTKKSKGRSSSQRNVVELNGTSLHASEADNRSLDDDDISVEVLL